MEASEANPPDGAEPSVAGRRGRQPPLLVDGRTALLPTVQEVQRRFRPREQVHGPSDEAQLLEHHRVQDYPETTE